MSYLLTRTIAYTLLYEEGIAFSKGGLSSTDEPPIAIRDSFDLDAHAYRFLLRGKELARGTIMPGQWLALNVAGSPKVLRGSQTIEPVFGIPATWVNEDGKRDAEANGFAVVDPGSVLITHLSEGLKRTAHLLIGRQDVQGLVDHLKAAA